MNYQLLFKRIKALTSTSEEDWLISLFEVMKCMVHVVFG